MKINKIIINNFCSIKHAEITANNFNVFVGQNNHGKTNLFDAIEWFYLGKSDIEKLRFGRSGTEEVSVEVVFSDIQDGLRKMKNTKNQTTLQNFFGEREIAKVKRTSLDVKTRKMFDEETGIYLDKNPTGFDSAFNDFLPKFEYISTTIDPLSVIKYGKNSPIANMLSDVLLTILETNKDYIDFKVQFDKLFTASTSEVRIKLDELSGVVKIYLEKQFEDCNKVVFEVAPPAFDDLLKNFETSIDDGVYTEAEQKGDGMQRALMLAIIQAYADFRKKNEESSKQFLFFIDEAELHLHPSAQRKLKNVLLELAEKGDQVFINTHSSVLVVDEHPRQSIFKVEKIGKETNIFPVVELEKPQVIFELLGGSPSDLLLPKNFFIVEGKSEIEFLTKIIPRFYSHQPKIQIVPADGNLVQTHRTLNAIEKIFKPLETSIYKDKLVIFVDKHDEKHIKSFQKEHPEIFTNMQFLESTEKAIESYYPNPWKKSDTEISHMSGLIKNDLAKLVGENITQVQFESEMPKLHDALIKAWALAFN